MITLSQANRLPVTIQYPYEKLIPSERFRGRIHFEFDKCIACEVCVRVCPIDLPVVDWKFETDIRKKRLLNYSIDFGICIFCEHELVAYDDHELNYNQIALGNLPILVLDDFTIRITKTQFAFSFYGIGSYNRRSRSGIIYRPNLSCLFHGLVLVCVSLFYIPLNSHFVAAEELLIYMRGVNFLIIFVVMFMKY
ncbi:hypothetical protein CUMW_191600 [Citrus unshiu]|uniref:4Fe-4S ferredoxin-type domain-containing protein n=1 Tax=Citrus unshiu TaxID=55188 RepID=A0A2H5Q329_CITUN|nr:hypothetical protein CUMW_191600 [Citrus unshiu]